MSDALAIEPGFEDLSAVDYGTKGDSALTVYGVNVVIPALAIAVLAGGWWHFRRRGRAALAAQMGAEGKRPAVGGAVVRGIVVPLEGAETPVRVTVLQHGSEQRVKNGWRTTWLEYERRTDAHPFHLLLADGSRLRVEPGEAPRLLDDLGGWKRIDGNTRGASATLDSGEAVFARGEVAQCADPSAGYRGGEAPVLRPPHGGSMLLSTRDLAAPALERAGRFRRWMLTVAVAAFLAQLAALPYHLAVFCGGQVVATIDGHRVSKGSKSTGHYVTYRVPGRAESIEEIVSAEDYARLPPGAVVPAHVSPMQTTLGPHPGAHAMCSILPAGILLVLCAAALWFATRSDQWYDQRRLKNVYSGRLDGSGAA